jgi:hypothetical protein
MTIWRENCASRFEANKAENDVEESRLSPWPPTFFANTSDLRNTTKSQKAMHHEEIELVFDASFQQILGLESEILWEARRTPTLVVRTYLVASTT